MSDLITGGDEVDIEIDRELTKRKFRNFVDLAWTKVCPRPLVGNFHVDAICDHLQAVSAGDIRNLIINIPPGMSKSLLTCSLWNPWEWTVDASIGWLFFSYDPTMVTNNSVNARKLVESEWYKARWPHVRMRRDQNQKTYYETTAGGFRSSIRTQGNITGKHPHRIVCFPAGTKVQTSKGRIAIEKLVACPQNILVLTDQGRFQRINRTFISRTQKLVVIRHSHGKVMCTPNHPIWVENKGWRRADAIVPGDCLRRLRMEGAKDQGSEVLLEEVPSRDFPSQKHVQVRTVRRNVLSRTRTQLAKRADVLQSKMLQHRNDGAGTSTRETGKAKGLRDLRGQFLSDNPQASLDCATVFNRVLASSRCCSPKENGRPSIRKLRVVRDRIRSLSAEATTEVLLTPVRQVAAFASNVGRRQSEVERRGFGSAIPKRIHRRSPDGDGEGRVQVPALQHHPSRIRRKGTRYSPHRLRQVQQSAGKPDDAMQRLPFASRWRCDEARVLAVETIETECEVFNLDIGTDHTYWADDVLVHNCDDPHDVKGSKNEKKRKGDLEWWDDSVSTRGVSLGVRRVIIMQRLGVKDLTGHIKDTDGDNWEFLILPMRYEGSTKVTSIGFKDPRTKQGELLAPQLIPESEVSAIERKLGSHHAAGQLQQRPTAKEGRLFKPDRLIIVPRDEFHVKNFRRVVRAWDKAGTDGAGCNTAGGLLGEDIDGNIWILDMVADQWGTDEVERQISLWCKLDEAKYTRQKAETVFEREGGASGIQAANETVRRNKAFRIKAVSPTGSKDVRAEPLANMINMRQIRMLEGNWNADLVDELRSFPDGEFLDRVDALSLAWFILCEENNWMPPSDDSDSIEDIGRQACENIHCDRLRTAESEFCCSCCESSARSGGEVEHSDECNGRHGQLYARGVWEPNSKIKRG